MSQNHYDVLGVARNASYQEIQKAYRKLAQELHPDTKDESVDAEGFHRVQKAYDILSDPMKRQEYDGKSSMKFVQKPEEYALSLWQSIF